MVTLKKIPYEAIEGYIFIGFWEDKELLEKYHKADKTMDEFISNLIRLIGTMVGEVHVDCYGVFYDEEPIGFSVLGSNFLYSFGIDVHFRQRDILLEWFELIKIKLSNEFFTWLYNENTRAIGFLIKNGMEISDENGSYKTLVYVN